MRIRLTTRPLALFLAMAALALLALLPMRFALGVAGVGGEGLTARRIAGSIWSGSLVDARFGEVSLGNLAARLSPLPLFVGRARIVFHGPGPAQGGAPALPISGAASIGRHALGIDAVTATVPTGRLFAPLPVASLSLDALSVRFRDGACDSADGRVVANVVGDAGGIPLPNLMSGSARCEAGALLLPMTSQAGTESVMLRIDGGGRYRADLRLAASDPIVVTRLRSLGFASGPGGYRLSVSGSF